MKDDVAFNKSSKFLQKFMQDMDHSLDKKNTLQPSFDSKKFEYSRILSTKESTFQNMHADYASCDWRAYKQVYERLNMTPLSALYYPQGN